MMGMSRKRPPATRSVTSAGFSLLEFSMAMAIFLVVGGASLALFSRHSTLLSREQGVSGLNIGLRNALSQVQMDTVNAGYGRNLGANAPAWPVGITIYNSNPTTSQCNPTATNPATYAAACFDKLNVVMADPNTPYLQLQTSDYGDCTTGTPLYTNGTQFNIFGTETHTTVKGVPGTGTSGSVYSNFKTGDQILIVKSGGQYFTTATLYSAGTNSSPEVQLTFNETQIGGFNYGVTNPTTTPLNDPMFMTTPYTYVNTTSSSPTVTLVNGNPSFVTATDQTGAQVWAGQNIQIGTNYYTISSVAAGGATLTLTSNVPTGLSVYSDLPLFTSQTLTNQFCGGDFVLRLLPIQYSVDVSDPTDPKLVRTQGGVTNTVMDQVIGFKVGAAWWDNDSVDYQYCYNTGPYCDSNNTVLGYNGNFALIRAVRVSIIGRTTPSTDPSYTYVNLFDGGHYQIRGNSIVVNPRNLSMNND